MKAKSFSLSLSWFDIAVIQLTSLKLPNTSVVWWVDLGWLPGAHPAAVSLPLLSRTGGENMMKSLWVEIRTGRTLTNYHHAQNRLNLGKLI